VSDKRIAVVTGANRGIGFEICRQLAQKEDLHVVLTSRTKEKGKAACEQLKKQGLDVSYYELDVTDFNEVMRFRDWLKKEQSRLDILVNNAGILIDAQNPQGSSVFSAELSDVRKTIETNTLGPLFLSQTLIPLMRRNTYGRIVNLSSGMGQLSDMNGGYTGYRLSKVSLNAVTRILADELKGSNILVNSMCPGWVKTEMGGSGATRPVEEGADTAIWLATLPDDGPSGAFFRDRTQIPW